MARARKANDGMVIIECPGCGDSHGCDSRWTFSGDLKRPTFSPSLHVRHTFTDGRPPFVCHSFVRDGRIEFLSDCTHAFAGQTVDLPDVW